MSISDDRSRSALIELEDRAQRMFFLCLGNRRRIISWSFISFQCGRQAISSTGRAFGFSDQFCFRSISADRISFYRSGRVCCYFPGLNRTQLIIHGCKERQYFFGVISFPEFKIGWTLKELSDTLRLFNAGKFDHDTSHPVFQTLDIGLYHTETVYTCTKHIIWIADGGFDFLSEHLFDLRIGAFLRNFILQLLCSKKFGKFSTRSQLVIFPDEKRDKIVLTGVLQFCSLFYRFIKSFVLLVIGQCFYYVGHRYFEYDVHTAFQVQT